MSPVSPDATPDWAYTEDGYCVCCGNGKWKFHMPACLLRDSLDLVASVKAMVACGHPSDPDWLERMREHLSFIAEAEAETSGNL